MYLRATYRVQCLLLKFEYLFRCWMEIWLKVNIISLSFCLHDFQFSLTVVYVAMYLMTSKHQWVGDSCSMLMAFQWKHFAISININFELVTPAIICIKEYVGIEYRNEMKFKWELNNGKAPLLLADYWMRLI